MYIKKTQVVKERDALIFRRYLWLFLQSLQTAAKSILVRLSTYTYVYQYEYVSLYNKIRVVKEQDALIMGT